MSAAPPAFGSCQERRLFPLHHAPDRLGVLQASRRAAPHVGPGCYDNHEYGTMLHDSQRTPGSKKGYVLSARTAARFPPCSQVTHLQTCTLTPLTPVPGTYAQDAVTNRKVSWPMCFGSPDWSRLPQPEKKSLRVKVESEKTFLKQRSRAAYLSLYY
uniref:Protein pitchfork n=1 Tax=Scophthalmus maximus TaxID=52904 RepID=A0A8D3BA69_SCOMX